MIRSRMFTVTALAAVLALAGTGCGDDDDEEASGGDTVAYCEIARALDEQEGFPSPEQLEEIRDAAPAEIRDEAEVVVSKLLESIEADDPGAAFDDPEVTGALGPIEAYDAENCGIESDGDE